MLGLRPAIALDFENSKDTECLNRRSRFGEMVAGQECKVIRLWFERRDRKRIKWTWRIDDEFEVVANL
jgi:hypothetical protein